MANDNKLNGKDLQGPVRAYVTKASPLQSARPIVSVHDAMSQRVESEVPLLDYHGTSAEYLTAKDLRYNPF